MAKKFSMNWDIITTKIKEAEKGSSFKEDERLYQVKIKEDGTAGAIIRFIPQSDLTKIPFVKVYSHGFKNGNSWFVNNCPTTIGKKCPVCEANTELWDEDPDTVRNRSRKISYYSNIVVVKDPERPENEGKVFIFRYGKKIHEKIMNAMNPSDGLSDPIAVFDYYNGANFKLSVKSKKVGDKTYPNYDESSFAETVTQVAGGDENIIEKIHSQTYDLDDFISLDKFKSYDELKEKFEQVTGQKVSSNVSSSTEAIDDDQDSGINKILNEKQKEIKKEEPKVDTDNLKIEASKQAFLDKLRKNIKS